MFRTPLLVAAFALVATVPALAASQWTTFTSKQFGLYIAYPDHLIDEAASNPGQGQYVLKNGAMLILSKDELHGQRLKSFLRSNLLKDIDVTYSQQKNNWMAYSGYAGDQIVYGRTHVSCGGRYAHTFLIRYPESQRRTYDAVVTRLSHSLRVTPQFAQQNC